MTWERIPWHEWHERRGGIGTIGGGEISLSRVLSIPPPTTNRIRRQHLGVRLLADGPFDIYPFNPLSRSALSKEGKKGEQPHPDWLLFPLHTAIPLSIFKGNPRYQKNNA